MSAILIVLLSGLAMIGTAVVDTTEAEPDTDEGAASTDETLVSSAGGGSNPLDEALSEEGAPEAAATDSTGADAAAPASEPDVETQAAPDQATDPVPVVAPTEQADAITDTDASSLIEALGGDDVVDGAGGDDTLAGGTGIDSLIGGEGADVLYGTSADGPDDGETDTLVGGAGTDTLYLGETDVATGGEGADTFVRTVAAATRSLVTDFNAAEDVIVVQYDSDPAPSVLVQVVASDGVIIDLSDGSQIELQGLTEAIDTNLLSFVDTRAL